MDRPTRSFPSHHPLHSCGLPFPWAAPAHRILLLLLILLAGGCGGEGDETLERTRREGFLRAAFTEEPPFSFLDERGRVGGESPMALRGALEAVGVDSVRWLLLDFEELLPALLEGRVDVVAAGLFPTPERAAQVRFSRPTSCARPALLVRRGRASPRGLGDFLEAGAGALAVVGSSVEHRAAELLGVPGERLLVVPDLATGVAAVRGGRARALALTAPTLVRVTRGVEEELEARVYEPPEAVAGMVGGCSALVFRPGDSLLARKVDEGLVGFIGSPEHRGALAELGLGAWGLPPGAGGP